MEKATEMSGAEVVNPTVSRALDTINNVMNSQFGYRKNKNSSYFIRESSNNVKSTKEQQEAFVEAIYANYKELQAQTDEIEEQKRKMDYEMFRSNEEEIHNLLFANLELHSESLGDWDTWEQVESVVKKYAYGRSTLQSNEENADHKLMQNSMCALQERINTLTSVVIAQQRRIMSLQDSVRPLQDELQGLLSMLHIKENDIRSLVSKIRTLNLQLRQAERECAMLRGIHSEKVVNGGLYEDIKLLIEANKTLEEENARLKLIYEVNEMTCLNKTSPRLSRTFSVNSETYNLEKESISNETLMNYLDDDSKRLRYLEEEIPVSAAMMHIEKANLAWMRRLENEVSTTMEHLDMDANECGINDNNYYNSPWNMHVGNAPYMHDKDKIDQFVEFGEYSHKPILLVDRSGVATSTVPTHRIGNECATKSEVETSQNYKCVDNELSCSNDSTSHYKENMQENVVNRDGSQSRIRENDTDKSAIVKMTTEKKLKHKFDQEATNEQKSQIINDKSTNKAKRKRLAAANKTYGDDKSTMEMLHSESKKEHTALASASTLTSTEPITPEWLESSEADIAADNNYHNVNPHCINEEQEELLRDVYLRGTESRLEERKYRSGGWEKMKEAILHIAEGSRAECLRREACHATQWRRCLQFLYHQLELIAKLLPHSPVLRNELPQSIVYYLTSLLPCHTNLTGLAHTNTDSHSPSLEPDLCTESTKSKEWSSFASGSPQERGIARETNSSSSTAAFGNMHSSSFELQQQERSSVKPRAIPEQELSFRLECHSPEEHRNNIINNKESMGSMSNVRENHETNFNDYVSRKDTSSNMENLRIEENINNSIDNSFNGWHVNNQGSNNVNDNGNGNIIYNDNNDDQINTSSCIASRPQESWMQSDGRRHVNGLSYETHFNLPSTSSPESSSLSLLHTETAFKKNGEANIENSKTCVCLPHRHTLESTQIFATSTSDSNALSVNIDNNNNGNKAHNFEEANKDAKEFINYTLKNYDESNAKRKYSVYSVKCQIVELRRCISAMNEDILQYVGTIHEWLSLMQEEYMKRHLTLEEVTSLEKILNRIITATQNSKQNANIHNEVGKCAILNSVNPTSRNSSENMATLETEMASHILASVQRELIDELTKKEIEHVLQDKYGIVLPKAQKVTEHSSDEEWLTQRLREIIFSQVHQEISNYDNTNSNNNNNNSNFNKEDHVNTKNVNTVSSGDSCNAHMKELWSQVRLSEPRISNKDNGAKIIGGKHIYCDGLETFECPCNEAENSDEKRILDLIHELFSELNLHSNAQNKEVGIDKEENEKSQWDDNDTNACNINVCGRQIRLFDGSSREKDINNHHYNYDMNMNYADANNYKQSNNYEYKALMQTSKVSDGRALNDNVPYGSKSNIPFYAECRHAHYTHEHNVESIRPTVLHYDFPSINHVAKTETRTMLTTLLARLRTKNFNSFLQVYILPIAAFASKVASGGKGILNPSMQLAVAQLRANEEQRRKERVQLLFKRVATNIRTRQLLRRSVLHGSAFLSYVALLYKKWRNQRVLAEQELVQQQHAQSQCLLNIINKEQYSQNNSINTYHAHADTNLSNETEITLPSLSLITSNDTCNYKRGSRINKLDICPNKINKSDKQKDIGTSSYHFRDVKLPNITEKDY